MKYISFKVGGRDRFGVVRGNEIIDLSARTTFASFRDMLMRNGTEEVVRAIRYAPADYRLDEVEYLIPVPDTDKIICVGVNYPARNDEYKDGSEQPKYPSLFMRCRNSVVGHGQPIVLPLESHQLDYEGEVAIVIGKPGRRISEERALDHVFGMTLCNEGSVRDWMRHGKFNVTQGKNFDASGSIGPWIVSLDEIGPIADVELKTFVNGELRQQDTMGRMMFPVARLISYISTFTTLLPGDIIVSGTPTGSGARFDPPRFLVPGDTVTITATNIGTLKNRVRQEGVTHHAE